MSPPSLEIFKEGPDIHLAKMLQGDLNIGKRRLNQNDIWGPFRSWDSVLNSLRKFILGIKVSPCCNLHQLVMSPPPSLCASPVWTTTRFKKGPSNEEGCGSFPLAALRIRMGDLCWAWHGSVGPSYQPSCGCDQSTWEVHIHGEKLPTSCQLWIFFFNY